MNPAMEYWSVTDVAECFSGLSDELRGKLWDQHNDADSPEFSEFPDHFDNSGDNSMVANWDKFSPVEQTNLNDAADRYPD
jgi:hypothetical protein